MYRSNNGDPDNQENKKFYKSMSKSFQNHSNHLQSKQIISIFAYFNIKTDENNIYNTQYDMSKDKYGNLMHFIKTNFKDIIGNAIFHNYIYFRQTV